MSTQAFFPCRLILEMIALGLTASTSIHGTDGRIMSIMTTAVMTIPSVFYSCVFRG